MSRKRSAKMFVSHDAKQQGDLQSAIAALAAAGPAASRKSLPAPPSTSLKQPLHADIDASGSLTHRRLVSAPSTKPESLPSGNRGVEHDTRENDPVDGSFLEDMLQKHTQRALDMHTRALTNMFREQARRQLTFMTGANRRKETTLRKEQEQLQSEIARLSKGTERAEQECRSAKQKAASLLAKVTEQEQELEALRKAKAVLEKERDERLALEREVEEQARLIQGGGTVTSLTGPAAMELILQLQEQLREGQAENLTLKAQLDDAKREQKNTQVALEQASRRHKKELEDRNEQRKEYLKDLYDSRSRTEELETQLAELQVMNDRFTEMQAQHGGLVAEEQRLRAHLKQVESKLASNTAEFRSQISTMRKRLVVKAFWFHAQLTEVRDLYKLTLSMDEHLQPEVTCKNCMEIFDSPQVLRCGHSVCARCVSLLTNIRDEVGCPDCKSTSSADTVLNSSLEGVCYRYRWWKSTLQNTRDKLGWISKVDQSETIPSIDGLTTAR